MQEIVSIKQYLPTVTEKLISVFGKKYAGFIKQRIKNLPIVFYTYPDEYTKFINEKLENKQKELITKFLLFIHQYNEKEDIMEQGKKYISSNPFNEEKGGLFQFDYGTDEEKIEYINLLRKDEITFSYFNFFRNSLEYRLLTDLINTYVAYYYKLKREYLEYKSKIDIIANPLSREKEKYDDILKTSRKRLLERLNNSHFAYAEARKVLNDRVITSLEKKDAIEYFSSEDERILNSSGNEEEKQKIYQNRLGYLRLFSSKKDDREKIDDKTYKNLVKRGEFKSKIPSTGYLNHLHILKGTYLTSALKSYFITDELLEKLYLDKNNTDDIETLFNAIRNHETINIHFTNNPKMESMVLIELSGKYESIDFNIIHELIHEIGYHKLDNDNFLAGIEKISSIHFKNQFDERLAEYTLLDEVITDLVALDVFTLLRTHDLFIVDTENSDIEKIMNENTSILLKGLVMPFYQKYKKDILDFIVMGKCNDNYVVISEKISQIAYYVNRLDYIIRCSSLCEDLKKGIQSCEVKEYEEIVRDFNNLVDNIDKMILKREKKD